MSGDEKFDALQKRIDSFEAIIAQTMANQLKEMFEKMRLEMNPSAPLSLTGSSASVNTASSPSVAAHAAWDVTEDSKSQTGYVIKLGNCNIYSVSRKQDIIAQSSCEAEYIAMTEASNECIGLKYLINELLCEENFDQKIELFTDSTAAMSNAKNLRQSKMRHLNRRLNVIKERINNGTLEVQHIRTDEQIADILTKPLLKAQFRKLRDALLGYA